MVVWPDFDAAFIQKEIREQRQWKLVKNDMLACNWVISFEDRDIWGDMDKSDAIYLHRICTNPQMRGNRFIDVIVDWAREYARGQGKRFVRLDTLGNNTGLIRHYTSAGFHFLGMHRLHNTSNLPLHYQEEPDCCLFEAGI
jgi:hypothetical protein